ncbi:glycosyltransferase [Hwanghaeella grinnelliae]|nr:glycosyltransferase [Hwanghaeella grinnelliae]
MRITFVYRLFSGFEDSFRSGFWKPTGVPTVYRLMEACEEKGIDCEFIFTAKDDHLVRDFPAAATLALDGLKTPVHIIPSANCGKGLWGKARRALMEVRQAFQVYKRIRSSNPDLVYIGNANLLLAGFLARFTNFKTLFRVMGIYPVMRTALESKSLVLRAMAWLYRSPFTAALGTQDGSGFPAWASKALRPGVQVAYLLNGVDNPDPAQSLPPSLPPGLAQKTVVLFVGKLTDMKGAQEFADGFLKAFKDCPDGLFAIMVGTGPLKEPIQRAVVDAGADHAFALIDRLPHDQILAVQSLADIYVSLNKQGNLSNANLEAYRSGRCVIIPSSQPDIGVDADTDELLGPDTAVRIPDAGDIDALAEAITRLHRNPSERLSRMEAMQKVSETLPGWDDRMARELDLLQSIAGVQR